MRIDLKGRPQPFPETEDTCRESMSGTHRPSASKTSAGEDEGELSAVHAQVRALAARAARYPEVRQERVRALRQSIERGLYCPRPVQVAGAILEHMINGPTA